MFSSYLTIFGLSWVALGSSSIAAWVLVYWSGRPFSKNGWHRVYTPLQVGVVNTLVYPVLLLGTGAWDRLLSPDALEGGILGHFGTLFYYVSSVEAVYYAYHRLAHSWPWLYKKVHALHHQNRDVVPADTFYTGAVDLFLTIQSVHLPIYWLSKVRLSHFVAVHVFYTVGSFLAHQAGTDHAWHHKCRGGNYAFLVPVFDLLFGTFH